MKIAFLNLYDGVNNRGAESFSRELARRLGAKIFSGQDTNTKIVQPEHNRSFLKTFFLDPASLSVFKFTLKILPRLTNYDWVIPMNGFWQVILCKLFLRKKILITGHSGPGWDERWNLYLKPDVFVATTEPTAVWARKTCPWTKVVTIPYGIDINTFAKAKPIKLDLEKPIILCPAAAVEYKWVDLAIQAVAKLDKGSLLYLGTGPLLSQIKDLGEKMLGKRFLNLSVNYEDMPKYYAAADVITLPSSNQENSPMVFLEAMAAGKTVVTTDAPRPRWILGEVGIFVDPKDTNSYAYALKTAIEVKSAGAMKFQVKKFSWDLVLREYKNIISFYCC